MFNNALRLLETNIANADEVSLFFERLSALEIMSLRLKIESFDIFRLNPFLTWPRKLFDR
jgi:hypothetical protein